MQVNNQPTVTGRSPGLNSVLNAATASLYLGGHPSFNHSQLPSDLPLHSSFRGCIYDPVFRSRDHDFNQHFIPTVIGGRGVSQCSIPSCRLRHGDGEPLLKTKSMTLRSSSNSPPNRLEQEEEDNC